MKSISTHQQATSFVSRKISIFTRSFSSAYSATLSETSFFDMCSRCTHSRSYLSKREGERREREDNNDNAWMLIDATCAINQQTTIKRNERQSSGQNDNRQINTIDRNERISRHDDATLANITRNQFTNQYKQTTITNQSIKNEPVGTTTRRWRRRRLRSQIAGN